jgi:hypothetical protein
MTIVDKSAALSRRRRLIGNAKPSTNGCSELFRRSKRIEG